MLWKLIYNYLVLLVPRWKTRTWWYLRSMIDSKPDNFANEHFERQWFHGKHNQLDLSITFCQKIHWRIMEISKTQNLFKRMCCFAYLQQVHNISPMESSVPTNIKSSFLHFRNLKCNLFTWQIYTIFEGETFCNLRIQAQAC